MNIKKSTLFLLILLAVCGKTFGYNYFNQMEEDFCQLRKPQKRNDIEQRQEHWQSCFLSVRKAEERDHTKQRDESGKGFFP